MSHRVVVREEIQRRIVETVNPHLHDAHVELREFDVDSGYPVFRLVATGKSSSRPKNLIFGSARKPDLRLSSTVDNEIEIVDAADALVFDDVIGVDGLRWRDLQAWWSRHHPDHDHRAAKRTLYARLLDALPESSPPQVFRFGGAELHTEEQARSTLTTFFRDLFDRYNVTE